MTARFSIFLFGCCLLQLPGPARAQSPNARAKQYSEKVQRALDSLTRMNQSLRDLSLSSKIAQLHFQLDSATGNWIAAMNWLEASKQISDSSARIQHEQQLSNLENAHDLQKKSRDVAFNAQHISLLNRQTALQNEALRNQRGIRNLLLGGVAMLLLLLVISYNRYTLKTRTNRALQQRQREINERNIALKQLVAEREWLLKEIHHRVKNNLQLVISLLNAQVADIKNEPAALIIRDSKNRMNAISIIHQRLFKGDEASNIDIASYIHELIHFLKNSFGISDDTAFIVDIQPLNLNISQAVPLGLIINEAITNALKYAFPFQQKGTITVHLKEAPDNFVSLIISDNGVGLPEAFNITASNTLGISLMQGLAEQIKGRLKFVDRNGLTLELTAQKMNY